MAFIRRKLITLILKKLPYEHNLEAKVLDSEATFPILFADYQNYQKAYPGNVRGYEIVMQMVTVTLQQQSLLDERLTVLKRRSYMDRLKLGSLFNKTK
jgi:hypothetical protein